MLFWFIAAALLLATIVGVVWPLVYGRRAGDDGGDVRIYSDQLAELDRDRDLGLVDAAEWEASRTEISRRLLQAARRRAPGRQGSRTARRIAAVALLLAIPLVGVLVYLALGSPFLPDAPLQARLDRPVAQGRIDELVAQVEAHLLQRPEDGQGWLVLAPVYVKMGRFEDAVEAYANALRLTSRTPALLSSYGEALVLRDAGMISEAARSAFEEAARLAPQEVTPKFFLAMALNQDGRFDEAAAAWAALLRSAPVDAPWVEIARAQLAAARQRAGASDEGQLSGPGRTDIEAAAKMTADERQAFVGSMVERLSARLDAQGGTVAEWIRLIRAYRVLGQTGEAELAYRKARDANSGNDAFLATLRSSARALGVEVDAEPVQ